MSGSQHPRGSADLPRGEQASDERQPTPTCPAGPEAWGGPACSECGLHPSDFTEAEYDRELTRVENQRDELRALLVRAEEALKASWKAALTVKGSLNKPYEDAPQWTPWTRWVEAPTRQAHDTDMAIRKALRDA